MLQVFLHPELLGALGQRRRPERQLFRLADEKVGSDRELRRSYSKFGRFLEEQFGFDVMRHAEFSTQQFACR
jgi:hypothetical protein